MKREDENERKVESKRKGNEREDNNCGWGVKGKWVRSEEEKKRETEKEREKTR